ncbi:ankyrin repeat-containing domain protein [Thamnidium elegans]|nr:ankyrin repeat-containing domain protein [Thamnidium elegans]
MHAAVSYGQIDIVKYLLEKGANVNIEDFEKDTPLYVAETVEMAQLLLDHGADPKRVNEEGLSPAVTALEEGYEDVAKLLADITKEVLPTKEEEENNETEALSHVQEEEDEEEPELSDELSNQMQEIMKRIEEQGGVENEEELRDMVTKMVVDGMRRNLEQNQ